MFFPVAIGDEQPAPKAAVIFENLGRKKRGNSQGRAFFRDASGIAVAFRQRIGFPERNSLGRNNLLCSALRQLGFRIWSRVRPTLRPGDAVYKVPQWKVRLKNVSSAC